MSRWPPRMRPNEVLESIVAAPGTAVIGLPPVRAGAAHVTVTARGPPTTATLFGSEAVDRGVVAEYVVAGPHPPLFRARIWTS